MTCRTTPRSSSARRSRPSGSATSAPRSSRRAASSTARSDVTSQCDYWSDWFCKDSSLSRKTTRLAQRAIEVAQILKLDLAGYRLDLKNCCPLDGKTYDCIRLFAVDEATNPSYAITPASGHSNIKGRAEIMRFGGGKPEVESTYAGGWLDLQNALRDGTTAVQL